MALWRVWPGSEDETGKPGYDDVFFSSQDQVAIGHGFDRDIREFPSKSELADAVEQAGRNKSTDTKYLWRIYDEMKAGDTVVVPRSNIDTVAIGKVTGPYEFRPIDPYHFRQIRWIGTMPRSDFEGIPLHGFGSLEPLKTHGVAVETRIGPMLLDDYITQAQALIERLDAEEMDYKRKIINDLGAAREAMLTGEDTWPKRIEEAFPQEGSPVYWPSSRPLFKWFTENLGEAQQALAALWADDDVAPADRITTFLISLPEDALPGGTGTRLRTVAALLMQLGTDYPPYMFTNFNAAYEATGYNRPSPDANEEETYEHALGFLDKLLERTRALGFERPADRLEAQSVVWMMAGVKLDDPPAPPAAPPEPNSKQPPVSLDALGRDLLLEPQGFLGEIAQMLEEKPQVIFQGPPGTGKTYVARELAECLAGSEERVRLVQFHPSYAYEDFVQGFRPTLEDGAVGFKMHDGPLVQMAEQARDNSDAKHFLVIDEINRGNIAKVFGELYFLLEYRDQEMRLQYSDKDFSLPDNLFIIGTMNTADRSIALVDLALRRRFSFFEFHPDKDPIKGLLERWLSKNARDMAWVADVVDRANEKLENREAAIGPSYFMKDWLDEDRVERIWEHDVLPYVEEQLYGQHDRLAEFALDRLRREAAGAATDGDGDAASAPDSDDA